MYTCVMDPWIHPRTIGCLVGPTIVYSMFNLIVRHNSVKWIEGYWSEKVEEGPKKEEKKLRKRKENENENKVSRQVTYPR